jgi:hypothetical protein
MRSPTRIQALRRGVIKKATAARRIDLPCSYQGWYARKKKRAIAKLEIGDAWEMRSRVLVALIAWTVLGSLACFYAARRVYSWITG